MQKIDGWRKKGEMGEVKRKKKRSGKGERRERGKLREKTRMTCNVSYLDNRLWAAFGLRNLNII